MAGPPTPSAPTRGRRDRRGEQRRAELLEAAIHLIGAHGLDAVTHRAVAAEAGVSPASTSYYFRSKDELIDEALNALATREIALLRARREALGEARATDLDEICEALSAWIEEQLTPAGRVAMLAQYQLQLEAARRPEARDILQAWKDGTDDLAETAMASLGARDVRTAGILLVCAIDGLRLRLLASGHEPLTPERLREVLRALLVGLVAA
jgi:TetR/AcrR family transcriptional regulator, regulator of biofilm formation and stress response